MTTPSLLERTLRECTRIASQYTMAVSREAGGRPHKLLSTIYRLARARLRYGVGPRYYSLFEFARVPEASWGDFVTDDPKFKKLLEQMSPKAERDIAHDKALFYKHCLEHRLPAIPVLGVVTKGPDVNSIGDLDTWNEMISGAPDALFIKPIDGTFGEGAFTATRIGQNFLFGEREGSSQALFEHLRAGLSDVSGWLIQPRLQCHPGLADIMAPQGLGTIRAVTCMEGSGPRLLLAILKITVGDNVTDNFYHGLTGNLVAAIDPNTGVLAAARGSQNRKWPAMIEISCHPDTGKRIEGATVPLWNEVVELVLKAQQSLPRLRSTGWDVAVTPEGPLLVETNAFYSIDILQVAYRRGLRRELMNDLGFAVVSS